MSDFEAVLSTSVIRWLLEGGMYTVLIADDMDAIRQLCCTVLQDHGYAVLDACDGQDALSLAQKHRGPIDLLITDMVMPRLGGLELSRAFKGVHPEAGVLFISGYHAEKLDTAASFLAKPFTRDVLLRRVDELLSNRTTALRSSAQPVSELIRSAQKNLSPK